MIKRLWQSGGRYVLPVCLVAVIAVVVFHSNAGKRLMHINVEQLSDYLRSFGAFSIVLGMLAVYVQMIVPMVPFVLVAGANVLVFGLFWGFVINYAMSVLGAFTVFMFARYFGHDRLEKYLVNYPTIHMFNKRMEHHGFFYVLFGRLIPLIPSTAVSLAAGISKVRTRDYMLGTVIGMIPIVLLESFIGHDLLHFREYKGRLLLLSAVFIVLLLIGIAFKNKMSSGKTVK